MSQNDKPMFFEHFRDKRILVTGGRGFVGRHLVDILIQNGADPKKITSPSSKECDLRSPSEAAYIVKDKDIVFHLAARVGGIGFNKRYPADLIFDNGIMGLNLINAAQKADVKKFIMAGTVCAYPKFTPTPFKEEDLWNGYPEETNAPYGVAKKMCLVALQAFRQQHGFHGVYLLPANLYGPHDNFDLENSHVIPAMIRKFIDAKKSAAKTVTLWGDGSASREFLFVEDCARGLVEAAMKYDSPEPVNLGTEEETNIKFLAETIKGIVGYKGEIVWDTTKPNGQPKRRLDVTRAYRDFGFKAKTPLKQGLERTITWYLENHS